jgi:hypothetical protein
MGILRVLVASDASTLALDGGWSGSIGIVDGIFGVISLPTVRSSSTNALTSSTIDNGRCWLLPIVSVVSTVPSSVSIEGRIASFIISDRAQTREV